MKLLITKNKCKLALHTLLISSLVMGTLLACTPGDTANTTTNNGSGTTTNDTTDGSETESPIDSELPTIDWYVGLSYFNFGGSGWGTDLVSKTIQEKGGVNINFIVPASDGGEQLSAMLAGDDVPDLLTIEDRNLLHQMIKEGYLISYNDLATEFDGQLTETLELRPDIYDFWASTIDGKTYGMPNYPYSTADLEPGSAFVANRAFIVREDLYNELGAPEVSNTDDLFGLYEDMIAKIGTYSDKELIPLQLNEGVLDSLFSISQYFATPVEDENGNYVYDMTQWQFKEALSFLNQAYRLGYVKPDNFSDTRDLVTEKVSSGQVFSAFLAPQDFLTAFGTLYDSDSDAKYVPLEVRNSQGEDPVLSDISGMGWLLTAISESSEHHEAIEGLLGYLLSNEGIIDMTYGQEGVTYTVDENGSYVTTDEYQAALDAQETDEYNLNSLFLFDNYAYRSKFEPAITNERDLAINDVLMKESTKPISYTYPTSKSDPDDPRANQINELGIQIRETRNSMFAQIVAAPDDQTFDSLYEETLNTITALDGFDEFLEYQNEAWQAGKLVAGYEDQVWWPNYR